MVNPFASLNPLTDTESLDLMALTVAELNRQRPGRNAFRRNERAAVPHSGCRPQALTERGKLPDANLGDESPLTGRLAAKITDYQTFKSRKGLISRLFQKKPEEFYCVLRRRRARAANPAKPVPSRSIVAGSGTAFGVPPTLMLSPFGKLMKWMTAESIVSELSVVLSMKVAVPVCPLFSVVLPVLLEMTSMLPRPPPPVLNEKALKPPEKVELVTVMLGVVLMPMPLIRVLSVEVFVTVKSSLLPCSV
jgi:hypothetical protein